ncbi:MAG: LAGLIDADG family homing endonuclease [Candidatus Liptonbacteria bacterium]|nr:LAGLIDADG family homing endonuclease [Candidatus Liptonbacteria bacterium]
MFTDITKHLLRDLYIRQKLSTWQIEKKTGRSRSLIYSKLKDFGIKPRSISDSHIRYTKKDFSGNLIEKAYIVGFTLGDLRVRKSGGENSKTISIGCASTKLAQISLFKKLFSRYGHIWESQPSSRGVVNVEAFVNLSFRFLLPKTINNHRWILRSNKHFLSFLAGFTDADGSVFINSRGRAVISWGNYNSHLLEGIKFKLEKLGIVTGSLICDHLKGYQGKDGYRRKADYYHLTCQAKTSIVRLLGLLGPLLKHSDRINCLKKALKVLNRLKL